ncbi:MAG: hypothetical protein KDE31_37500, partial [Caldilineaceae bacterium]|nr:hypothetical protein [Caldilineaceae bacterium]
YFTTLLERSEPALHGKEQFVILRELNADFENLRTAWDWALEQRHVQQIVAALDGMAALYSASGRIIEGSDALQRARTILGAASIDPLSLVQALLHETVFCRMIGQGAKAQPLFEGALEILKAQEQAGKEIRALKAIALWRLADHLWYSDVQHSQTVLKESLAICTSINNHWAEGEI